MERRDFLKRGCLACAAVAGLGLVMESCAAIPTYTAAKNQDHLKVPLTEFTPAANNMVLVRNTGLNASILVVKKEEGFKAFLMVCTHEGFGLTATETKIICHQHGSQFDLNGNVIKSPADRPLKEFKVTTTPNNAIIHLT